MKKPAPSFAKALRLARTAKGIPQEAFDLVSSRTYVSAIERGLKQPTIAKVDDLAAVLEVHPLTLLTLAYIGQSTASDVAQLLGRVQIELVDLLAAVRP